MNGIAKSLLDTYALARGALLLNVRREGRNPADAFRRQCLRRDALDAFDEVYTYLHDHCDGSLVCGDGRRVSSDSEGGLHFADWSRWPRAWEAYLGR